MNEDHYIVFDQYLQDELSAEDKVKFENQLAEDPELASAFDTFKELQAHLDNTFGFAVLKCSFEIIFKFSLKAFRSFSFPNVLSKCACNSLKVSNAEANSGSSDNWFSNFTFSSADNSS